MGQNEILFYIMAAGCMVCLMIGIVKKPAYLLVLLVRGAFCSLIVYGICIFCAKKRSCSSCQFKFPFYWNRCIAWSSWNCYFVCDSSVIISLGERLMIICR